MSSPSTISCSPSVMKSTLPERPFLGRARNGSSAPFGAGGATFPSGACRVSVVRVFVAVVQVWDVRVGVDEGLVAVTVRVRLRADGPVVVVLVVGVVFVLVDVVQGTGDVVV